MLGLVVLVEVLSLMTVLVQHRSNLEGLIVFEAVGFGVDRVEVAIVELVSLDEFSIGFCGFEEPLFLKYNSGRAHQRSIIDL